jgi:hypothetical protein
MVKNGKVMAGSMAVFGKKDVPARLRSQDGYLRMITWIGQSFFHLFDAEDRRSWLIDGASALLHLVRVSLVHDKTGHFRQFMTFQLHDIIEYPNITNRKCAATAVLLNEGNKSLRLHADEPRDFFLKDKAEQICLILEQLMSYQELYLSDSHGPRSRLGGFDFMDVATGSDPFYSRAITLLPSGKAWVDFIRATNAPTLFGQGFGEVLKPIRSSERTCPAWSEVPQGMDYLAVCVSDLREISRRRGTGDKSPWRLFDEIYWHKPNKLFEACPCEQQDNYAGIHLDRVQVLVPGQVQAQWGQEFQPPGNLATDGAVIFGYSETCPLHWEDYGYPEKSKHNDESWIKEHYKPSSLKDSGIGSSRLSTAPSDSRGRKSASSFAQGPAPPCPKGPPPPLDAKSRSSHMQNPETYLSSRKASLSSSMSSPPLPPPKPSHLRQGSLGISHQRRGQGTQQTFRVRGIPSDFNISRLKVILESRTNMVVGSGIRIKSFTTEAHTNNKVATISFDNMLKAIPAGSSWGFNLDDGEALNLNTVYKRKTITIDNHFNGLTILYSPEVDHSVE